MNIRYRCAATVLSVAALLITGTAVTPGGAVAAPVDDSRVVTSESSTSAAATTVRTAAVTPRQTRGKYFRINAARTGDGGESGISKGHQSLIHIDDPRAPQRYTFDVDLPASANLVRSGNGPIAKNLDGTVLAGLTPPWAKDALGVELATRFEVVDRDTFVQVIEHRVVATYPVVADPWWVIPVVLRAGGRVLARQVTRASTREAAMRIAKRQVARSMNYQIEDLLSNRGLNLKTLTKRNLRENVRRRIGWSKATLKPYDAHHTLPVKFETFFDRAGLNIHNPVFGHPWCRSSHRSNAFAFNAEWESFRNRYRDRVKNDATSRRVIEEYRIDMVSKYSAGHQCARSKQTTREAWRFGVVQPELVRH